MDLGLLFTIVIAIIIGFFLLILVGGFVLRMVLGWFVVRTVKKVFKQGRDTAMNEIKSTKKAFKDEIEL